MPVFLLCFIVFIIWLRVKLKKSESKTKGWDLEYWEREQRANFARKEDIRHLAYIKIPIEELPFQKNPSAKEKELEEEIHNLSHKKILNLSSYSNIELKESFGMANFDELTEYDQNFLLLLQALNNWGTFLYEEGKENEAKTVMEYALSIGSDLSNVYTTLGKIYQSQQEIEKFQSLVATVKQSDSALKDSVLQQLEQIALEY